MNYRHAFHAGNHADVLKHVILCRILVYLAQKDKPFAMLDTHAGIGRYDLAGPEALKTGEWRSGIGKIPVRDIPDGAAQLLEPYFGVIARLNPGGELHSYPGSPELAVRLLRAEDRMVFNELHPVDAKTLVDVYRNDSRVLVTAFDALRSVKASLPFNERRGLVLIDPAFEAVDETDRVIAMLREGMRRMATAIFMVWYPVTSVAFADDFCARFAALGVAGVLQAELRVKDVFDQGGLAGSGVIVVNPPFTLADELDVLLPLLAQWLGREQGGRGEVNWLTPPR